MVTPDGHAKLLDFGLAKLLESTPSNPIPEPAAGSTEVLHQTTAGTVLGTLSYMSPEQTRGQSLGPPSDIFSLGIVLYETLTGRLPFAGESPVDTMHAIVYEEIKPATVIRQDLPPEIHRIISTCLRKMPRDRYPEAGQLARDLKRLKQDVESGVVRKVSPAHHLQIQFERLKEFISSMPLPVLIAGTAAVLIAITLIIGIKWEGLIPWAIVGLLVFRYVKNRKKRLIKKFINRIRRFAEVKVVTLKGDRIRVYARNAEARLYVRINSLVDDINRKLVFGQPLEVSIEADLTREQLSPVLKESGVLFVRDEVLRDS
jgi:hypothetical protein